MKTKKIWYLGSNFEGKRLDVFASTDKDCLPPYLHKYLGCSFTNKTQIKKNAVAFLEMFNRENYTEFRTIKVIFN